MLYKFVPDVRLEWMDVLVGAAATSVLFTLGKFAIGFYLGRSGFASTYGAAGSLAALLLWVYYSAQVFFFGAEFTCVYTHRHGSIFRHQAGVAPAETGAARRPTRRKRESSRSGIVRSGSVREEEEEGMKKNVVALFRKYDDAERAVDDLIDRGVDRDNISIMAANPSTRETAAEPNGTGE